LQVGKASPRQGAAKYIVAREFCAAMESHYVVEAHLTPRFNKGEPSEAFRGVPGPVIRNPAHGHKDPFAWAISSDNKSIVGADMDSYFLITLVSPDRMDKCYVHNG
jgi:hypothetical protein